MSQSKHPRSELIPSANNLSNKATRDHFGNHLLEVAAVNPHVFVVNCDLSEATRTTGFKQKYQNRFIECGISEANAIGVAAGLAQENLIPIVTSFGHFISGKYLEIFQTIGLNNIPVIIVGSHAGMAIGKDGATQMGLRDLALMRTLPNVRIIHPADEYETYRALEYAIEERSQPTYFRLCRQATPNVFQSDYEFKFGSIPVLVEGNDLLILSQGGVVPNALEAIKSLEGIYSIGLANVSSLPINMPQLLDLVSDYQRLLVLEDHYIKGGIADEISMILVRAGINRKFASVGIDDYCESGAPEDLYRNYGLDVEGIKKKCQEILD